MVNFIITFLEKFSYGDRRKDTVPDRKDKPILGLKTSKNFLEANAVDAIQTVPKVTKAQPADFLHKADFGRVPAYLRK